MVKCLHFTHVQCPLDVPQGLHRVTVLQGMLDPLADVVLKLHTETLPENSCIAVSASTPA